MRTLARIALYSVFILLIACGGDTGFVGSNSDPGPDPDPDPGGNPTTVVALVNLLASNPQLATGDDAGVTITAIVRDAGNLVLRDKTVTFSANSGALQVVSATTNAEGIATAKLTTGGNESNRTITVSALSGDVTASIDVEVAGTAITVSGQSTMVLTDTNTLTLTLKDSFGIGIFDQELTVTSTRSPTLSELGNDANSGVGALTVTTDASGQAHINLAPSTAGNHTLTVSALGATKTHAVTVSNDVFLLTMPGNESMEVNLAVNQQVKISYQDNGGPVSGATVNFVTTRGGFGLSGSASVMAVTNSSGEASVNLSSLNAGPATIQAYVAGGPSTTLNAEFVATTSNAVEVQTNLSTVSLGGGQATITATVRDANNNLVKNKAVNFSLIDVTGGSLTVASDITDSNGQASTVYESAATASAKDGVTIIATVDDGTNVNDSVTLTVGNRALFITVGSGNEMIEPDTTNYQKPFTVRVADASGAGVANVEVSLALIPERYFKGIYMLDTVDDIWFVRYSINPMTQCVNEDANSNGIFDDADDINPNVSGIQDENGDGILWPGTVATVSDSTVTTDDQGQANFTVNYSQEYANFVYVRLEATATVGGTEAINTSRFRLPVLASDVNKKDVAPPGREAVVYDAVNQIYVGIIASPFGYAASCDDPE